MVLFGVVLILTLVIGMAITMIGLQMQLDRMERMTPEELAAYLATMEMDW